MPVAPYHIMFLISFVRRLGFILLNPIKRIGFFFGLFLSNEFLKSKSELSPDDINEGVGSACAEGQIEVFSRANPDKSYLDAIVSVFEIDPAAAKELKKEKSKELFLSRVYNFKEDDEGTQSAVDPLFKVGEVHPYGVLYLLENIGVVAS